MIRLLKKSEIEKLKSSEKQKDFQEGIKLAKQVDTLRELAVEEEKNLEKFRTNNVALIQKDINSKIAERDNLDRDIARKREEWKQLLEPLDRQWPLYVKTEKGKIDSETYRLNQENARLAKISEQNRIFSEDLIQKENILEIKDRELTQMRIVSVNMKEEAENILNEAKTNANSIVNTADKTLKSAEKKFREAEIKEQSILDREKELEKEKDILEEREMKVLAKELIYYSPVKK
jgi:hypothetical protein